MTPASGRSAPDRIAISVLLPAPFCPTSAHTSPGATWKSTPATATVAPNALRTPSIWKRGAAAGLVHFSHFERSGLSSSFIAGSSMFSFVAMCTPVSIRFSTFSPLMCETSVLTAR